MSDSENTVSSDMEYFVPTCSEQIKDCRRKYDRKTKTSQTTNRTKRTRVCPKCNKTMKELVRHLVEIHKMQRGEAIVTAKNANPVAKSMKKRHLKRCKICTKNVQRLDLHLRRTHHYDVASSEYRRMLKLSNKFEESMPSTSSLENSGILPSAVKGIEDCTDNTSETTSQSSKIEETCRTRKLVRSIEENEESKYFYLTKNLYEKFSTWLQSINGGCCRSVSSEQYARQAQVAIKEVNYRQHAYNESFTESLHAWAEKLRQKKFSCHTLFSYFVAIDHFLRYLKCQGLSNIRLEPLDLIQAKVTGWKKTFCNLKNKSKNIFEENQEEEAIFAQDVKRYKCSDAARNAVSKLSNLSEENLEPSPMDFANIRNHLMVSLLLSSGQRAGALKNLTIREFKGKKYIEKEEAFILRVKNHKTSSVYGDANISIDAVLARHLDCFISKIRAKFAQSNVNEVFVTTSGRAMKSSDVTQATKTQWVKAGCRGSLTSRNFRRFLVTLVHRNDASLIPEAADMMCHKVSTAAAYYKYKVKPERTAKCSKNIQNLLEAEVEKEESKGDNSTISEKEASSFSQNSIALRKARQFFSDEEREEICNAFAEEIDKMFVPKISYVKKVLPKKKGLEKYLTVSYNAPRKIMECVRGKIEKLKRNT